MDYVHERAEQFFISSQLLTVATILEKRQNQGLTASEMQALRWASSLVAKVDWSHEYPENNFSLVSATSIRPTFYKAMRELKVGEDILRRMYDQLANENPENTDYKESAKILEAVANKYLPYCPPIR